MTSKWEDLRWGPWPETAEVPHHSPDEATRAHLGLPRTLRPVSGEGVSQRPMFDPSLKHYSKAMRAGDPRFDDPRVATRWYAARQSAVDHVLATIAGSECSRHLVLRGSVTCSALRSAPRAAASSA